MLTIYGTAKSRALRCLWAAEESGLEFEHVPLAAGSAEVLAMNPSGKIPVLQDGPLTLAESLAINLHIAHRAGAPLLPPGDGGPHAVQWSFWAATELEPNIMQWAVNAYMRLPALRDTKLAVAARSATEQRLALLERRLARQPFLLGESFSIADCSIAGVLYGAWMNGYNFTATPRTRAWIDGCLTRPAALRARRLREG